MTKWRVHSYDVWGNAEDGYEVNDKFRTSFVAEFEPEADDEEIVDALIECGYLKSEVDHNEIDIDGDDDVITLDDNNDGRPICELVRE